jgi:hypothetical protein
MAQIEAGELCALYFSRHNFKLKITGAGWGMILKAGDVMRARNRRDRRAWRGRYFLRDLAGFADIERLLAADIIVERLSPDAADDDAAADVIAPSAAPRPQPEGGLRRRR